MSDDTLPERMRAAAATMREADELLNPGFRVGGREYSWLPSQLDGAATRLEAKYAHEAAQREAAREQRVEELATIIAGSAGYSATISDRTITLIARQLDAEGYRRTDCVCRDDGDQPHCEVHPT